MFLAHSANDHGKRDELATHLRAVADKAAEFAGSFGSDKIAWYIGLWHDLGKFSSPFQQYLLDCEQNPEARGHGPDHKAAGAEIARKHLGPFALLVQGHHGGLQTGTDLNAWLKARLNDAATVEALDLSRREIQELEPQTEIEIPDDIEGSRIERGLPLWSNSLGLTGRADAVEFHGDICIECEDADDEEVGSDLRVG